MGNFIPKLQSSSSSSLSSSSAMAEPTAQSIVVLWDGIMVILANHYNNVEDIRSIIMLYLFDYIPSFLMPSSDLNEFFVGRPQFTLFKLPLSDLAEVDQYSIWGRPEEVKSILDRNTNPSLFTTNLGGEDHRGPGHISVGPLFVRLRCVGDFLMADMIESYVMKRCGEEEFKRQLDLVQQITEEENKKKENIAPHDLIALNKVWEILINADEKTLGSNVKLEAARVEFQNQLRQPGNEKIIEEIANLFDRDIPVILDKTNNRAIFAANRIFGLAQRMRLPICVLQNFFTGILDVSRNKKMTMRIDARRELGVQCTADGGFKLLGFSCHLGLSGLRVKLREA